MRQILTRDAASEQLVVWNVIQFLNWLLNVRNPPLLQAQNLGIVTLTVCGTTGSHTFGSGHI